MRCTVKKGAQMMPQSTPGIAFRPANEMQKEYLKLMLSSANVPTGFKCPRPYRPSIIIFALILACTLCGFSDCGLVEPVLAQKANKAVLPGGFFTIKFPLKGKIGEIGITSDTADYCGKHAPGKKLGEANGPISVPIGSHISFRSTDFMGLGNTMKVLDAIPSEALTSLTLSNTIFDEKDLQMLARFSNLRRLELTGTEVSDDSLKKLAGLKQLETLILDHTRVRGRFLFELNKSIKHLNFGYNDIDLKCLVALKNYPKLSVLKMANTHLLDGDMKTVKESSSLIQLDITDNPNLSDKCVTELKQLKKLNMLLVPFTKITAKTLMSLKGLPLTYLRLQHRQGSAKDIDALKRQFRGLTVVWENLQEESVDIYKEVFQ